MNDWYKSEWSNALGREMGHAMFGDSGHLMVAFGPQNGHTYDFRNFGMVDSVQPWIESGKLRVLCVDSIDEETWSNEWGDPRSRLEQQERWFSYITDELLPQYLNGERALTTGCSMGATHAANFFFRRPDIFSGMIALSGLYGTDYFFHGYKDDLTYANSPLDFLKNMPEDHPWMDLYRRSEGHRPLGRLLGLRRKPRLAMVEKTAALLPRPHPRRSLGLNIFLERIYDRKLPDGWQGTYDSG